MAQLVFDAAQVPPQEAMEPIPAGWYEVRIVESEYKPTKDGSGAYYELVLEVISGQFAKRKLWDRLNTKNNNQMAMEIAYRTLSAICHAAGIIQIQDTQQLHGVPILAKVTIQGASVGADGKSYDAKNEIRGYKAVAAGAPSQPPPGQAPAGAAPPWAQPKPPPQAAPQPMQQPPPQQAPWQPPPQTQPAPNGAPPWQQPASQPMPAQPPPASQPPWQQQPAPAPAPAVVPQQAPWTPPPAQQPQPSAPVPPWAQR